ncbi:chromate transporter [Thermosediminibacter oceani]|uniref:Chromate transporter n=1 Tax=Thermosediminibacter oceani (strain ATCC BAA-1034 / DSM 16646 / JW/IW-1228P) TaxID=555079 RepID=D9S007_THEOJ|nr:chromate transporter [Thermosediminibacter oceani]ADL08784.1 Chromate transporter [Thermosediminibacter oceani DSM 16646]
MIYRVLFLSFFKIGLFSFGGGYAMIPLIQKEIIDINGWLTLEQFMDIIAISQMTPGPIAVNAATFVGYRIAGFWGAAAATAGVTAPSLIIILLLAFLIKKYRGLAWVDAFFSGVRPAVIALIVKAAYSLGRGSILGIKDIILALAVLAGLYIFKLNPILIIALAAAAGILIY